jgi:hypothetical protein
MRSVILAFLATAARALAPPPRARAQFSRVRLGASELLLVDHVNLNHEKGRHDLLVAFYGDLLGLAADPRKAENLEKGAKTLWYNAGIHQLHLPEGSPRAQPLDGRLTLAYASLDRFDEARLARAEDAMRGSRFAIRAAPDGFDRCWNQSLVDGRPGISSNPSTSLKSNSFFMIFEPLILASRVLDD